MNPDTLRILSSGAGHPHMNLALDEALLHSTGGPPTLRLYRWHPAGLSLGYFQSAEPSADIRGDHVLVRRITGGGAIYHGDEITYSLTLDAALLPDDLPASYDLIHGAIAAALGSIGVAAAPRGSVDAGCAESSPRPESFWCFAHPSCEDLVTAEGRKIVGSAQRRIHTDVERVLHHGSLVLTAPAATDFCGSVADVVDPRTVEAALEEGMVRNIAAALDLDPQSGVVSVLERRHAEELSKTRYQSPAFIHRR